MFSKLRSKRKLEILKEKELVTKGGKLLEERIATCYGRENPIRIFSALEINKAIQDFQQLKYSRARPTYLSSEWNRGILDGRIALIKTYEHWEKDLVYRDITVSSMMSSHGNVLKLLGCCLECLPTAIVYEDAGNGHLNRQGGIEGYGPLPWKSRVRIARQVASAVAYMHTAFPRPIIHRDIKPTNILLDHHFVPKLTEFSLSISIPEGESQVEDVVMGTYNYCDPSYIDTGFINEKSDVYSFGMFLLVVLTGREAFDPKYQWDLLLFVKEVIKQDRFGCFVDPAISKESAEGIGSEVVQLQLKAFLELALRCTRNTREDRPPMMDVAKELLQIERSSIASGSSTQETHFQIAKRWEELNTSEHKSWIGVSSASCESTASGQ